MNTTESGLYALASTCSLRHLAFVQGRRLLNNAYEHYANVRFRADGAGKRSSMCLKASASRHSQ
eukprot:2889489-Pleurochrysis_carterae.AAC.6